MIVHFICEGNTYRSRLAEAYFNSLGISDWEAVSSGVRAERNLDGLVCSYTAEILKENGIEEFDRGHWTQTSIENLADGDLTVFMHSVCYDLCLEYPGHIPEKHIVWDIADMDGTFSSEEEHRSHTETARETYRMIRAAVDGLVAAISEK